jgi:hypothetical protein
MVFTTNRGKDIVVLAPTHLGSGNCAHCVNGNRWALAIPFVARTALNVGYTEANLAVVLSRTDMADEVRDAISREIRND